MDFNHFLTSYMPDTKIGSKTHFDNMLEQAVFAEKLGYTTISIPEHHLVNILLIYSVLICFSRNHRKKNAFSNLKIILKNLYFHTSKFIK